MSHAFQGCADAKALPGFSGIWALGLRGLKMRFNRHQFVYSVPWNLFLLTAGSLLFAVGFKAITLPHGFITGGISGVALLLFYLTDRLTIGVWYLIVNVPIFLVGWKFVSRRFFLYSLFGMVVSTAGMDLITFTIPVHDPFLAVLSGGAIMGAGCGVILRSMGSAGGNDIIGVILNQKFNLRIGSYYFFFNVVLFSFSFGLLEVDLVLYSLAMSFVLSQVLDYCLSIFNQRKMVMIISEQADPIAAVINQKFNRGATFLHGQGTYTGRDKKIIMTVVNNYEVKRLEEAVFTLDAEAFMITENTFNVLGKGFSSRKVY
jgi:uncharacterized membrane-anchored protein YitT (DUF2179 family)